MPLMTAAGESHRLHSFYNIMGHIATAFREKTVNAGEYRPAAFFRKPEPRAGLSNRIKPAGTPQFRRSSRCMAKTTGQSSSRAARLGMTIRPLHTSARAHTASA